MFATGPLAAVRHGMWGWLMLAGVAWLAIAWTVLRLEPADIVHVAGPVVLFGAVTEALRACAGARTWWMNAAMSLLFAATGVVLITAQTSSYTTPAALVGWYLMVRGAVDVAVGMMTRENDKVWGLIMVVGVLEAGLGFFAAGPLSRTADLVVTIVGGLGLLRGVADLVTGLRLREVRAARADVLDLPPERADGLAGYTAGLADFDTAPPKPADTAPPRPTPSAPRHRAIRSSSPTSSATSGAFGGTSAGPMSVDAMWPYGPSEHGLGAAGGSPAGVAEPGIAAAGGMAAAGYVAAEGHTPEQPGPLVVPGTPGATSVYATGHDPHAASANRPQATPLAATPLSPSPAAASSAGTSAAASAAAGPGSSGFGPSGSDASGSGDAFHQEVLRTTADLDAMLALAGVTGAAVGHHVDDTEIPEVPDTPEGVDSPAESTGKTQSAG